MLEKQKDKMPKIDPTKLTKEIKNKYSVVSNAFRLSGGKKEKVKDGKPKDLIITEVGDVKQEEFYPQVKIGRWGDNDDTNEVNLSLRLIDNEIGKETLATENDKIKWSKGNKTARFYEIEPNEDYPEGAFEFDIELAKKPKTNKIGFSLNTKRVDFFYQPALTEEFKSGYSEEFKKEIIVTETDVKDLDGNVLVHRPENVVGSYVPYYKNCPANVIYPIDKSKYTLEKLNQMVLAGTHLGKINKKGELDYFEYGKDYKVGKVGHIYRPEIYDATGASVWGILSIDKEAGKLTVEIPQDFLDKAVYPVVVDPTFGYTTAGSSYFPMPAMAGSIFSSGGAGTLSKITAYVTDYKDEYDPIPWSAFSGNWQYAIYDNSDNKVGNTSEYTITGEESDGWFDLSISNTITNQNYWLYVWGDSGHAAGISYDVGGTHDRAYYNGANSYNSWPTTLQNADFYFVDEGNIFSIYATYTAGGGETTRTPRQGFINLSTMSVC